MAMNGVLALGLELVLASAAGGALGLLFFGGLWWTVRRAFDSPRPALWVGCSLLLRMACVASGFVLVSAGDWRRLLVCLLGFWIARGLVVRLTSRLAAPASGALCRAAQHGGGETRTDPT
jgi:F1F0 ATPase subunit 2